MVADMLAEAFTRQPRWHWGHAVPAPRYGCERLAANPIFPLADSPEYCAAKALCGTQRYGPSDPRRAIEAGHGHDLHAPVRPGFRSLRPPPGRADRSGAARARGD